MIAPIALALALLQSVPVDGLKPGESAVRLAPAIAPLASEDFAAGRVVDAETGRPVAGAAVEAWTEEISRVTGGFHRVGEAASGIDGGFRVRVREGAVAAEKARVRAAGYLTASTVVGDLALVRLFARPEHTLHVRVLDLEDRPIAGALVTTSYSCAHDLPAFEVATDAQGIAPLPEYGLQDATPSLRVKADGHGALKYVDLEQVLPAADGSPAVLRLARRRPLRARLVDAAGLALAERALHVVDGEGFHVARTAADGRFEVGSPYEGGEVTVSLLGDGAEHHVFHGRIPAGFEPALRVEEREGESASAPELATLILEWPRADDAPRVPITLFHASGFSASPSASSGEHVELEVPAGELVLAVGGAFSGWREAIERIELRAGERKPHRIEAELEARLVVLAPQQEVERLVIQAGEDSIELGGLSSDETSFFVPAARPLVVVVEGAALRRLALGPIAGEARADLRGDACRVESPRATELRTTLEVIALDGAAAPLEGELSAAGPGDPRVERVDVGRYRVEAPLGTPLLVAFEAPSRAPCRRSLWTADAAELVELRPSALASLRIESPRSFAVEAPEPDLTALHPGPLRLVLRAPDGERIGIALELAPGEQRSLRVP